MDSEPQTVPDKPATEPETEIAHATRGRVRLKIPAAKRNPELLNQIKTAFEGIPGIDAIEVRKNSGSLVIFYDPDHHVDIASLFVSLSQTTGAPLDMAPHAAAASHRPPPTKVDELTGSIEAEAEYLAEHSAVARSVVEMVKQLDRQLKRSTGNNIDLKIMVPIILAGFTFLEIGAAAATPMWVTLAIFSMNHFVELHAHDADKSRST
jgi:Heavy metal associated domain 2